MKRFRVSDESVNSYGTRVLSGGIDMKNFRANPVGLWNHNRAWRGTTDEVLPICRWKDIEVNKNGSVDATPEFDMDDEFAAKVANKVEKGFLNACSIGIKIIEMSEDKQFMLAGQKYPTITKSELMEISICDIPANKNAVALYDREGKYIDVEDEASLNLAFGINNNLSTSKKVDTVMNENEILQLKTDLNNSRNEILQLKATIKGFEDAEKLRRDNEIDTLLSEAVSSQKIKATDKEDWKVLLNANFEAGKNQLSKLGTVPTLASFTDDKGDGTYEGKTFSELVKEGKAAELKAKNPTEFRRLYKAEFGKDYKD